MLLKVIVTGTIRKGTVSHSPYIVTMALSCIISEIKQDISQGSTNISLYLKNDAI